MWTPIIFLPFAFHWFFPLFLHGFLSHILRSLLICPGPGELHPRILKNLLCPLWNFWWWFWPKLLFLLMSRSMHLLNVSTWFIIHLTFVLWLHQGRTKLKDWACNLIPGELATCKCRERQTFINIQVEASVSGSSEFGSSQQVLSIWSGSENTSFEQNIDKEEWKI